MSTVFATRRKAGEKLATKLMKHAHRADVLVLALPRGGVPVAFEVARALHAPLDVFVVRKLGVPGHEEYALGAVATGGIRYVNQAVVQALRIPPHILQQVVAWEEKELDRRNRAYRGSRPAPDLRGRIVILVDDGLATGSTMRAAAAAIRQRQPARLIVAVPTAAQETCDQFRSEVDEIICAVTPEPFYAVGLWYHNFEQVSDAEVHQLLEQAARKPQTTP